jgi:lipopolysaccharide transport system permease protein
MSMKTRTELPTTIIEPPRGLLSLRLDEVWRFRDLLWMLVWRDITARYRQSLVGCGWAIFKPVLSTLIYALVFGMWARLPSDGIPYSLFVLTAIVPWSYFSGALTGISNSVVGAAGMMTKVYFPRLILPLSSLGSGLVDMAIQLVLLGGFMAYYGYTPGWSLLLLPVFIGYTIVASFAVGIWLTTLNVRYRDVGQVVPFLLQIWMLLSPVVYASSLISERWRWYYGLNPVCGLVEGFRWCILGAPPPQAEPLLISAGMVLLALVTGLMYFRQQEVEFVDVI